MRNGFDVTARWSKVYRCNRERTSGEIRLQIPLLRRGGGREAPGWWWSRADFLYQPPRRPMSWWCTPPETKAGSSFAPTLCAKPAVSGNPGGLKPI